MASSSTSPTPPLGKYLASTGARIFESIMFPLLTISSDKKTRDKAVKNLAAFLSDPEVPHISSHEMDKLWKGIFYCELQSPNDIKKILMTAFQGVWMSDRTLVQQALASELANILLSIDHSTASFEYLGGFWRTIVREWEGIDYLR